MNNRRGFLKALGLGSLAIPVLEVGALGKDILQEAPIDILQEAPIDILQEAPIDILQEAPKSQYIKRLPTFNLNIECGGHSSTVSMNEPTKEGINHLLSAAFLSIEPIREWRLGIIDACGFTCLCRLSDTYHGINMLGNGWYEFRGFDRVTRPLINRLDGANTSSLLEIYRPGVIKGLFICGGENAVWKGDSSSGNVLWSYGLFNSGDITVDKGDVLKIKSEIIYG